MPDRRTFLQSSAAAMVAHSLERFRRNAGTRGTSQDGTDRRTVAGPKVACVLSTNVTLIDWVGPEAVFDAWLPDEMTRQDRPLFDVFTVGEDRDVHGTGFNTIPDYTYDDSPQPQIIVVPAQEGSPRFYDWLEHASKGADLTMSVCIGARHLARLGMLDGRVATTHHDFIKPYAQEFPKVRWISGPRFVESSRVATSAGVTAGIDLALHVVERHFGKKSAIAVTKALEYQGKGWIT